MILLVTSPLLHLAQFAVEQGLEVHNFQFLVFSLTLASYVELCLFGKRFHTLGITPNYGLNSDFFKNCFKHERPYFTTCPNTERRVKIRCTAEAVFLTKFEKNSKFVKICAIRVQISEHRVPQRL